MAVAILVVNGDHAKWIAFRCLGKQRQIPGLRIDGGGQLMQPAMAGLINDHPPNATGTLRRRCCVCRTRRPKKEPPRGSLAAHLGMRLGLG